ncbi:hypothetical protein OFN63_33765, partial [Escherichia coli]|nr:hypothetical protein [Escherichia coli]
AIWGATKPTKDIGPTVAVEKAHNKATMVSISVLATVGLSPRAFENCRPMEINVSQREIANTAVSRTIIAKHSISAVSAVTR